MQKLTFLIFSVVISIHHASADDPASPYAWLSVSANRENCFRMIPEKHHFDGDKKVIDRPPFGVASRLQESGELQEMWRVEGWYAFSGHLSNEGRYFVRMGPWASDQVGHTDLALAFYDRGKLLKEYRVKDLIKDASKLEYSVSHYRWQPEKQSMPTGFVDQWESRLFHLVMVDKTTYDFDFTTGAIVASGTDSQALSSHEIFAKAEDDARKAGISMLESSDGAKALQHFFKLSEVSFAVNTRILGIYFEGSEWCGTLTPKTPLQHPCEVNVVYPVTSDRKIILGVQSDVLMTALKTIMSHPYVENRFRRHSAIGVRIRMAGDRMHWDTDEVQKKLKHLKMESHSLERLKAWAEVIVDEPDHMYHSVYLNVITGQIMKDDKSTWPYGVILLEKEAKLE